MPMKTNESAENYLETILILSKAQPAVRSIRSPVSALQ